MDNLKQRWKLFLTVVADPWNLLLTVAVGGLFALSLLPEASKPGPLTQTLLLVLITITSAILGGRISQLWVEITEGGVVVARGRSAVRSLMLLLRGIGALEARLQKFRTSPDEIQKHPEVTKRNYEEGIAMCSLLQEQAVSSIENWTDIVPEADIKTLVGTITTLKSSLENKETELEDLKSRLTAATGQSEQDRKHLREQIAAKERQILTLEAQLMTNRARLGGLGTIGVSSLGSALGVSKGALAQYLDAKAFRQETPATAIWEEGKGQESK